MTEKINTYRTSATIVGLMFVAGLIIGIGGNVLNLSILGAPDPLSNVAANSMLVAVAAFCWLMTVVGDAAHAVLMFPILKQQHSERIAIPEDLRHRPYASHQHEEALH